MAEVSPDAPPAKPFLQRRWVRVLLVVFVLLVGIRIALPYVIVSVAESQGAAALGRTMSVANVDLGLFEGRVQIDDVWIGGPLPPEGQEAPPVDPATAVLGLSHVGLDLGWLGLLSGEVHVQRVQIDGPTARLERRDDGSIEPLVLAEPAPEEPEEAAPEETAPEGEEEGGGMPIVVDVLDVSQVRLELSLQEAQVIDFGLAGLSLRDFGLRDGAVSLGDISLSEPTAHVRRDLVVGGPGAAEGEAAEADAEAEAAPEPLDVPAEETAAAAPPDIGIDRIGIDRAAFAIATDTHSLDVALGLEATDVNLVAPFPLRLRLDVGNEGGYLEVEGQLRAIPPRYDGAVRIGKLPLVDLYQIADLELPVAIDSGTASADLQVVFGEEARVAPAHVTAKGELRIDGLGVTAEAAKVALGSLQLNLADANVPLGEDMAERRASASGSVALADLSLDAEAADVAFASLDVNLERALVPLDPAAEGGVTEVAIASIALASPRVVASRAPAPEGEAPAPEASTAEEPTPAEAGPPLQLSLAKFDLSDGKIDFNDTAVDPAFAADIRDLNVKARDLQLPARSLRLIEVKSRGPGPATLHLRGGLAGGKGKVDVDLDGVDLSSLNTYVYGALGQPIETGTLTARWDVAFSLPEKVVAENDLVLHQIAFGGEADPAFASEFGVSLPLAVALLADQQGNIQLKPTVVIDSGSVEFGPIIREALSQALTGALRAPLKGLGAIGGLAVGVFTGDSPGFQGFRMEPGTTKLATTDVARVAQIAELLNEKPALALSLSGSSNDDDDRMLSLSILSKKAEAGEDLPPIDDVGMFQRGRIVDGLKQHAKGEAWPLDPEDQAVLDRWIAAQPVTPEARADLTQRRATAIRDQLSRSHGIASERLRLADAISGKPGVAFEPTVAD